MGVTLSTLESVYSAPASYEVDFSSPKAVKAWIEVNGRLIREKGKNGNLTYHIACGNIKASPEVIRLLSQAYTEANFVGDRNGNIPLHYACAAGHSLDVIRVLLEYYPGSVSVKDKDDRLALHFACLYSSCEVIGEIYQTNREAAQMTDKYGYKPFYYTTFNRSKDSLVRRAF